MKSRFRMLLAVITFIAGLALLFAALALPVRLAAQDKQNRNNGNQHHHYQVIDIGTFGGPSSYFNDLSLTDVFGFPTAFYGIAQVLNKQGILVGFADTSTPDPYPAFCFVPECFVSHAFAWQEGVKTDLGVLPGGASSEALWINSKGLIVGNSQNGELDPLISGLPEIRAVLWQKGQIADLGTLGGSESFVGAVNDRGQVAGFTVNAIPDPFSLYYVFLYGSSNGTQTRAFLWDKDGGMQDLGTLGGPDAAANLVNGRGQVAGISYTNSTPDPNTGLPTFHPFLWEKGKGMKDLGSFGGAATASVNGLNERGEVVGGTDLPGDMLLHPFLWDGEKLIELIAPPFVGNANGEAGWINEAGEVVGGAGIPGPCPGGIVGHAFLWRQGVITDLGTVGGTPNSTAIFVNSKTQIVGFSFACDFSVFDAILWENGSMVDLNTLIPPDSPFHLYSASFIDDRGVIAAFGVLANGDTHALLLIPCDEHHPGVEGCDYSLVEANTAVPQNSPAVRDASSRTLPPSLQRRMSRMSRYRFPGRAFGPKG
jgi:probable HAF family extracellular repeat protein